MFTFTGTTQQKTVATTALDRFRFPWDRLAPSLAREGRTAVEVGWEDLSRYRAAGHDRIDIEGTAARPVERTTDGQSRTLGLFYLPPYTRIVIDSSLVGDPRLAAEVIGAEAAHLVDYHYMTAAHRRQVVDLLHDQDLPAGADVSDGAVFRLDGHVCSWFDVGSYEWWVGEAFMESFVEAYSDIPVTLALAHPTPPGAAATVRSILGTEPAPGPAPEPEPIEEVLEAALLRFLRTRGVPEYLRDAADAWLARDDEEGVAP